MGHVEVLYVTEFVGLILIWWGYGWNTKKGPAAPLAAPALSRSESTA
jgi:hypothetical protein